MQRKLIKQGGGGFTIYLPKSWVDDNGLNKGDVIDASISGKELILSARPSQKKSETTITLNTDYETTIRTMIVNSYRAGYDKIKINFKNKEQLKTSQYVVSSRLIGFDTIKKMDDHIIVENITEPDPSQFDNILSKIFSNIEELLNITKTKLNNKNEETEDFYEVEERIQKYDNFCRRAIIKQKYIKKNPENFIGFMIKLQSAQREMFHINLILSKRYKKERPKKETIEFFNNLEEFWRLITESYYKKDINLIARIHQMNKDLVYDKAYKLLEKNNGKDNLIILHIVSCMKSIHYSTSSLAGMLV